MYSSYACLRHVESKQGNWPCWFNALRTTIVRKKHMRLKKMPKRFHELLKNILFEM